MLRPQYAARVANVTKEYGDFAALDDVSFEIAWGETLALLGPNGAGKSTAIEILEGYRQRTAGTVEVLGVDPAHGDLPWKARLGIVLQQIGENSNQTVKEQLSHFASFYPNPRNVAELIEAVGLQQKQNTKIGKLSGGQRRRLDVALGIVGNPDLLFLDEPTVGFDPKARQQFWGVIRQLQQSGTTILLTTHYLDEAAELSDRAAIISQGRLVQIAPIDQIGNAEARIPIVRWQEGGETHEVRIEQPGAFARDLVERIGEPEHFEVVRPTLEDVYLQLLDSFGGREARPPEPESAPAGTSVLRSPETAAPSPGRQTRESERS